MTETSAAPLWFLAAIAYVTYFGVLGLYVATQKNRNGWEGFWLGILAGPLGIMVAALLPTIGSETETAAGISARSLTARLEADANDLLSGYTTRSSTVAAVTLPAGEWSARGRAAAPAPAAAPQPEYVHKPRKLEVTAELAAARAGARKPS